MNELLNKEFEYYLDNQDAFVEKYNGKFIVIKNEEVIGVFNNELIAVEETSKHHELGTFLVQPVFPKENSHTQMFYSRVVFAS